MTTAPYLDPVEAAERPRADFIRYLLTSYPLRDRHLRFALRRELEQPGTVWQRPYVEGSQPYVPGARIAELAGGVRPLLHPDIARIFPAGRQLYQHQQAAIEAVVRDGENIVVATGTGSGKTECFLIPMIDGLLKDGDALKQKGVRALLLYPMNALVNDQVKRLRRLLCRQDAPGIRFGFYTSRTPRERGKAVEALRTEFRAYKSEDLRALLPETVLAKLDPDDRESLLEAAIAQTQRFQALSREEIWEHPPHILVTNYSMLEHMLIRPRERERVFEASASTFRMLVVDEAHSYDGATGSEVALLIARFKAAVGIEATGRIRGVATSASLGDREADPTVLEFASALFGEPFARVVRGARVSADERFGAPYGLPPELTEAPPYEILSAITLPGRDAPLARWKEELAWFVPAERLAAAEAAAPSDDRLRLGGFLWHALAGHPLAHRLIDLLAGAPRAWHRLARAPELWGQELPFGLDGEPDAEALALAERALAVLLQIGTLARLVPDDMPLSPVRLHLLFRSMEGVFACINPACHGAVRDPEHDAPGRYGKLFLEHRTRCDECAAPVLELASCRKCGQGYGLTVLGSPEGGLGDLAPVPRNAAELEKEERILTVTAGPLDSLTVDEEAEAFSNDAELVGTLELRRADAGWQGCTADTPPIDGQGHRVDDGERYLLRWHQPPRAAAQPDGHLPRCPACGAMRQGSFPIRRFVSFTDAPLEVLVDSLFELLPDPRADWAPEQPTGRRVLTFSDGRQDAAFFATDFQRTHTEALYRQLVWRSFKDAQGAGGSAPAMRMVEKLTEKFLTIPIPHPDRDPAEHHRSYTPHDPFDDARPRQLRSVVEDKARKRARELVLREFGLPSARRFSLEALGLVACYVEWDGSQAIARTARRLGLSEEAARLFLDGLADVIRLSGAVDLQGASAYFPETGGDEGGRPGLLDGTGRSKRVVKLLKAEGDKDRDAISMSWREGKDGKPASIQNALAEGIFKMLDRWPTREEMLGLMNLLTEEGFLNPARDGGKQLAWELLVVQETHDDWYRCSTCQQQVHRQGLAQADPELAGPFARCLAYRCEGRLVAAAPTHGEETDHYRYLMRERPPFPLRAQEHTAQLGVAELEARENRFIDGRINLLSSSTTLEMGVDIGELQAVALRNFPPHVSNYQQRAGRAGRRADGVAVTVMYGQRRPHDRYYFERPELLIAGKNQIPRLDPDNSQVQHRHVRAELLATYLRKAALGAEDLTLAEFFSLPDPKGAHAGEFQPPAHSHAAAFLEWLASDEARTLAARWLERLGSRESAQAFLNEYLDAMQNFVASQLADWNSLAGVLVEIQQAFTAADLGDERKQGRYLAVQRELGKVAERVLHTELAQACVLPIYGFPIDVVRLVTGASDIRRSSQGRHRLERDRRLALSEYAPGQDVVVDDRVHRSVGIMRPGGLEKMYYWVCKNCNYFVLDKSSDSRGRCPICESTRFDLFKRAFRVPKAFTTSWDEAPRVAPASKPVRQPVSQVFLALDGEARESLSDRPELYELTTSQRGQFFLANQGPKSTPLRRGFAICARCGRDLSDKIPADAKRPRSRKAAPKEEDKVRVRYAHNHPITAQPCEGTPDYFHLGHVFRSDLLKIRFMPATQAVPLFERVAHVGDGESIATVATEEQGDRSAKGFWYSTTYALLAAAALVIDVPRTELDGLFLPADAGGAALIVVYDNVPGGAGYSKRIAQKFKEVLERAYRLVNECPCEKSCYDCLRTYSNQPFHDLLDRQGVAEFLRRLVEQVAPDPTLASFAPHANRVRATLMADRLPGLARRADPPTLMALPAIEDVAKIDAGVAFPWFKLITEAIYALRRNEAPLRLVLNALPQKGGHQAAYVRKRLAQWVDQGLLELSLTEAPLVPTLCFGVGRANGTAMRWAADEPDGGCWFETRSVEGVRHAFDSLVGSVAPVRAVKAEDLAEPKTTVAMPKESPEWANLAPAQMAEKLGLARVLQGCRIRAVSYQDRYLTNTYRARFLADLLETAEYLPGAPVAIRALVDAGNHRRPPKTIDGQTAELEAGFARLAPKGAVLEVEVQGPGGGWFNHARELVIEREDGEVYVAYFDKGLDFVSRVNHPVQMRYSVTEATYVVVTPAQAVADTAQARGGPGGT